MTDKLVTSHTFNSVTYLHNNFVKAAYGGDALISIVGWGGVAGHGTDIATQR